MIPVVTTDPEWQAREDQIVGRMLRNLRAYEGQVLHPETFRMMRAIISGSVADAVAIGARDAYVRTVGECLMINGVPFLDWESSANDPQGHHITVGFER